MTWVGHKPVEEVGVAKASGHYGWAAGRYYWCSSICFIIRDFFINFACTLCPGKEAAFLSRSRRGKRGTSSGTRLVLSGLSRCSRPGSGGSGSGHHRYRCTTLRPGKLRGRERWCWWDQWVRRAPWVQGVTGCKVRVCDLEQGIHP